MQRSMLMHTKVATLALVVAAVAAVVPACSYERIRVKAATDLECPSGQITLIERSDGLLQATGCDRMALYSCVPDDSGREVCRRMKPDPRTTAQNIASTLVGCPSEQFAVKTLGPNVFELNGCQRTVRLECRERGHEYECRRLTEQVSE